MKIITINTHSYIEDESEKKLNILADAIFDIQPDIVAMQEINQKCGEEFIKDENHLILNQFGIKIKNGNYAYRIADLLFKKGSSYKLVWVGIKRGYKIFDEGLCFLTKEIPDWSDAFIISKTNDITNWKKRMALGIKINNEYFYNVHMGRWDDNEEPFYDQWKILNENTKDKNCTFIMGDFNVPDSKKNQGYDLIISSGWYDTYHLAQNKDEGYTVKGKIDGWKDEKSPFKNERIDYIFTNEKRAILSSYTIFNEKNKQVISDHFGIMLEYERR